MPLPYSAATSGKGALDEARQIVQFEYRGRRVQITASAKGYAAAWLKENPYSSRRQTSQAGWNAKALKQGQIAVCSLLRDWIKSQITLIECGVLSFEGAFLGQLLLPDGETVLERVSRTEMLSLPEPKET